MLAISIIIWLFGLFVFFFLLYNVIQYAINQSDLAKNVQEIKELLKNQMSGSPERSRVEYVPEQEGWTETCPGCGSRVPPNASICSDCGLNLR
ncbi:hypothetical protein ACF3MZ_10220 [Paenibacillaceae bacterium WGS1546]|uniref:hypothetical protein n=1 Tax=Cohnella sp. WGS1546 TaxID=3366810 RepID=UPI00372D44FE